jgi:phospholipase/carboxylesterase
VTRHRSRSIGTLALNVLLLAGCSNVRGPEVVRLQARPMAPTSRLEPGAHPLGLGGRRDGTLYVPTAVKAQTPVPLMVLMHSGGTSKEFFDFTFPLAEARGVAILTLDSRDNTWDAVDSPFGPDVRFIDRALRHTFERVAIDPRRVALGGVSDGASYALSLGLINGDLFSHVVAFAPGFILTPAPPVGHPLIFVAHGTRDTVLSIDWTSRRFVPRLKNEGYDVTYLEFDGSHNVPAPVARAALEWLTR